MPWIAILLAGLLEIVWATAMKQSAGFTRLIPSLLTVSGMLCSVGLLAWAMRALPLGTAYAVWTGIGAVGAFLAGVLLEGETLNATRLLSVAMIVGGIVMLKASSPG